VLRRRIIDYVDHFEAKKLIFSRGLSTFFSPLPRFLIPRTDTYTYNISGRREFSQEDEIEYRIHLLHLRADESQKVQFDPSYVPTPILEKRLSHAFRVSSSTVVKYGLGWSHFPMPSHAYRCYSDMHIFLKEIEFCWPSRILTEKS
jgi:hypothetical protein